MAEPSLFVVVSHEIMAQYVCSIVQLEPPPPGPGEKKKKTRMIPTEFSVNFSEFESVKHSVVWGFSPLVTCTKSELYIVPDWYKSSSKRNKAPLPCGIFDLRSNSFTQIKEPHTPKYSQNVVTLGNHIYFMANPREDFFSWTLHPFERYNTLQGSWEVLEPYPYYVVEEDVGRPGNIVATVVVLDDTILLSIDAHKIWAYDVPKGHWYLVNVKNQLCYRMIGQTVALKNTIYAIPTGKDDIVLELSIERRKINGGLVFTLDLQSEISVPGLKRTKIGVKLRHTWGWTSHFVHLGKDNFCLVQGCNMRDCSEYQYILVTYIKLNGQYSTVTNRCVHKFKIHHSREFKVQCSFSLPKSKTTVLEEGQRLFTVNLNPGAAIEPPIVGRRTLESAKEALRKTNTNSEDTDNDDDSMSDLDATDSEDDSFKDSDESSEESDSDESSEEETPPANGSTIVKVEAAGKKRFSDSEPKTTAANKKVRDGKNAATCHVVATLPSKLTKKKHRKHVKVCCSDTTSGGPK